MQFFLVFINLFFQESLAVLPPPSETSIMDHPISGCPTNAQCTKDLGEKRNRWLSVLSKKYSSEAEKIQALEKFRQTEGIPLSFWPVEIAEDESKHPDTIFWDVLCRDEKKQVRYFKEGRKFFKDFFPSSRSEVFLDPIFLLSSNKQVVKYFAPKGQTPVLVDGARLVFLLEEEGNYFSFGVSPLGAINFMEVSLQRERPEVNCPEELTRAIAREDKRPHYKGYACFAVWNLEAKKNETILGFSSCDR